MLSKVLKTIDKSRLYENLLLNKCSKKIHIHILFYNVIVFDLFDSCIVDKYQPHLELTLFAVHSICGLYILVLVDLTLQLLVCSRSPLLK